jgi:flavin-dependent dehydrogenase
MSASRLTRIAIAGSGPSGSTLAALLADKGADVTLFNGGKRPAMIVGESGIPALVPLMRRLGIEEEVASIAQLKPGATFALGNIDEPIRLSFQSVKGVLPTYSYNLPRPQFDQIIENRARRGKVRWIDSEATLLKAPENSGREINLGEDSLSLVPEWNGGQPDLIVDATGRRRTIARMLDIPVTTGARKDMALFAHYEGWKHDGPPGQIVICRTSHGGWSWQIPLPGRMSVGVVINGEILRQLGSSPEERLENAINGDPILSAAGSERKRVSEIPVYTNYQLISDRAFGPGWVALGDAFGFVDPMLSPGMWIAMRGGECLADLIHISGPNDWNAILSSYESEMKERLTAWQELISKFYNGEMMAAYSTGLKFKMKFRNPLISAINSHFDKNFAAMCCGAYTERPYSRGLLNFLCKNPRGFAPSDFALG